MDATERDEIRKAFDGSLSQIPDGAIVRGVLLLLQDADGNPVFGLCCRSSEMAGLAAAVDSAILASGGTPEHVGVPRPVTGRKAPTVH